MTLRKRRCHAKNVEKRTISQIKCDKEQTIKMTYRKGSSLLVLNNDKHNSSCDEDVDGCDITALMT